MYRYLILYIYSIDFPSCLTPPCPLLNTYHIFEKNISLIDFRHKFYQNIACGAHFQFSNHDLFEKVI